MNRDRRRLPGFWQLTGRLPSPGERADLSSAAQRERAVLEQVRALFAGWTHDRDPARAVEAFLLLRRAGVEIGEQMLAWLEVSLAALRLPVPPQKRKRADDKVKRLAAVDLLDRIALVKRAEGDRSGVGEARRAVLTALKIKSGAFKKVRQRARKNPRD